MESPANDGLDVRGFKIFRHFFSLKFMIIRMLAAAGGAAYLSNGDILIIMGSASASGALNTQFANAILGMKMRAANDNEKE